MRMRIVYNFSGHTQGKSISLLGGRVVMLQGFYMLALQRARRQRRIALLFCAAALVSALFAARAYFAPEAVPAGALAEEPYVAQSEDGRLIVSRGGETVLRTAIDVRTLPAADREALADGIVLADAEALARLLEDYGS